MIWLSFIDQIIHQRFILQGQNFWGLNLTLIEATIILEVKTF